MTCDELNLRNDYNMGNHLKRIALYCDCLEKPWQPYQPDQSESSSKSQQKQSSFEHKEKSIKNHQVIFDVPQQRMINNNPPLVFSLTKQVATNDDLDDLSNETDMQAENKRIDDMEIIDLERIDPNVINREAKQLNLHKKGNSNFKKSQQKPLPLNSLITTIKPQHQQSEDTLSNMFENQADDSQAKNKYFIEGEEELYEVEHDIEIDRQTNSKKASSAFRNFRY